MKKFKIAGSILFLSTCVLIANAQIVALYHKAPRCIFLKSDQDLILTLNYYDRGAATTNIKRVTGYSIDANLNRDGNAKPYMAMAFYKLPLNSYPSPMTINVYFDKMPDTANYYLYIPEFKQGTSINTTIPSKLDEKTTIDICCKGEPIVNNEVGVKWPPVLGYNITGVVFPGYKGKK